jgi:hypothetical protein
MTTLVLLLYALAHGAVSVQVGIGSPYWPRDGHCGLIRADGKAFTADDDHIANRELPLGTPVLLCNLHSLHCTTTHVRDRGTFGFCQHKVQRAPRCPPPPPFWKIGRGCPRGYRYVVRTHRRRGECGYYRGIADLTLPVARRIALNGLRPIVVVRLPRFVHELVSAIDRPTSAAIRAGETLALLPR